MKPHRPMCHTCWHLVPQELRCQVYANWNAVTRIQKLADRRVARVRFQECLDAAFEAASDAREKSPAKPAEWLSDTLVELVARAYAAEGYKNAEEAYADGISRRYCEDFAYAALRALQQHGYRLIPPASPRAVH